jgi:hypothetical protein
MSPLRNSAWVDALKKRGAEAERVAAASAAASAAAAEGRVMVPIMV